MKKVYIGIGSNLGDKRNNCLRAIALLKRIPDCESIEHSGLYMTEPVGVEDQDWYVNGVASLTTALSAQALLRALLSIESRMGRIRRKKWDSRIIDLDILIFDREVIQEEHLRIPHPLMHARKFVLEPLSELAPELIHPILGVSISELLRKLPEDGQVVRPLKER